MILYTDMDPFCCSWLEELVRSGCLPKGDVLCADMTEINPETVRKYTQRHWCCGIGGWPLALQIAGWPIDRPIDSASLPCQPFSVAGLQKGESDERHLWPSFRQTVKILTPPVIVGEQVPAAIKLGWLDGIFDDLERENYACGAVVLPACSVGSPNIRQRLWWCAERVADSEGNNGRAGISGTETGVGPDGIGWGGSSGGGANFWSDSLYIPCADGKMRRVPGLWVANTDVCTDNGGKPQPKQRTVPGANEKCRGQWQVEPSLFPLADGLPNRVGILRGAGNSINAYCAAEFIKAYMGDE